MPAYLTGCLAFRTGNSIWNASSFAGAGTADCPLRSTGLNRRSAALFRLGDLRFSRVLRVCAAPDWSRQLTAPRLATRLAMGVEIPLAHAIVDRLLGFDRPFAETRLQLTPVEWGVWTFLVLRALDSFDAAEASQAGDRSGISGIVGPADLTLDRVGPDPFDPGGLGSIVTVRWSVRVGSSCVRPAVVASRAGGEPFVGPLRPDLTCSNRARPRRRRALSRSCRIWWPQPVGHARGRMVRPCRVCDHVAGTESGSGPEVSYR